MERIEATEKYLRENLSKYSKATIIEAIFRKFDYTQIDILCHYCFSADSIKRQEAENKRMEENLSQTRKAIDEYNGLAKELKEKGIQKMPLAKIQRMQKLLEIIRKV